ncbi:hypothetical protein ACOMHN_004494 [Nucella lapillus]
MNPHFQPIGEAFVKHYYSSFDSRQARMNLIPLYSPDALLTFEGEQCFGTDAIRQRLTEKFTMGSITRAITKVDCQPTSNGGILVFAFGQLADTECQGPDKPMGFSQMFLLRPQNESFVIANEIFRLVIHDH